MGTREAMRSKSSSSRSTAASWAMAMRWSTALVEPPVAATAEMAFSTDSRVMMSRGRTLRSSRSMTIRPASKAVSALAPSMAGTTLAPGGLMPRKSSAVAMVLAVNWPPQAPAPGQAAFSISISSSAVSLPAAWAPTPSNTSWMVMSWPRNLPGAMLPL